MKKILTVMLCFLALIMAAPALEEAVPFRWWFRRGGRAVQAPGEGIHPASGPGDQKGDIIKPGRAPA